LPFKKIEVKKRSSYVVEQIIEAIQKGVYKIGDKLPSEREIAEKTGVSRPSVREALVALDVMGIIETKRGDGSYIRGGVINREVELQTLSVLERTQSFFEVLEARKILEEGVVRAATQKATSKDLKKMQMALEAARKAVKNQDYEQFEKADWDFHTAILKTLDNSVIEAAISPLINAMRDKLWAKIKEYSLSETMAKKTIREHERIFEAIKEKKGEVAARELVKHLGSSMARLLKEQ